MLDVLIIGAGQAGLGAGKLLSSRRRSYLIVDGAGAVGDSWRRRYRSLTLFTPRRFSALPGKALPGGPDGYPSGDEFAEYLFQYAEGLPIVLSNPVVKLTREAQGPFNAILATGESLQASKVIIATGGFQKPVVPVVAANIEVPQHTPETYRDPSSLPSGTVAVVGDGASGRDIAAELAVSGRKTLLATGKPRRLFPERLLGLSIWRWLELTGLLGAGTDTWVGRRMRELDSFPDRNRNVQSLRSMGVQLVPRVVAGSGRAVTFADGLRSVVDGIIWCVGYRDEVDWVDIAGATQAGTFVHRRGVSPIPGLFFIGRPWQRNRASALVMGVGDDAREIVGMI